ncbi:MAG: T9SS type A sorting domain-containing protein [bacterium]
MLKKCVLFTVVLGLAACAFASSKMTVTMDRKACKRLTGDEPIRGPVNIPSDITLVSPGQKIGDTYYDTQHNSAISRMIAKDVDDYVQAVWMKSYDSGQVIRHVSFNNSEWWPPAGTDTVGLQIDPGQSIRAGYITFDVLADGRGVAFYHVKMPPGDPNMYFAASCAVDILPRLGSFQQVLIDTITTPPSEATTTIWPHGAVDLNDNLHVVASRIPPNPGDSGLVYYSRSTDQGMSWATWQAFDSLFDLSYDVTTSRLSGKVCIAYTDNVGWSRGQVNMDVYYIESTDYGVTWDWTAKNNVTNFVPSDTTRAYCDVNGVYDNDDSLHLVYSLRYVVGDSIFYYASYIEHWSKATGRTVVSSDTLVGWHSTYGAGGWRMHSDHPSIGVDTTTGYLYCIFAGNPWGDTSAAGYPNYDIYGSYSTDGGATWSTAVNLTNTSSKDCGPPNCDCEDYANLAEIVNDTLHIFFVEDKDAGASIQTPPEGATTLNPVRYWSVPVEALIGVEEADAKHLRPEKFSLAQNSPNPFADRTAIKYELPKAGDVKVLVYDATGRLVEILIDGKQRAGIHEVVWDGNRVRSGIYFYKIVTPDYTSTRKMVVLK